eukprot:GHVS01087685.1.p1 GENE.GHVS01087685.1~~GHVS01087685.1.p1  ORF type:complete len:893 (-),score=196.51 GHVS01087685.1:100-2778(-)
MVREGSKALFVLRDENASSVYEVDHLQTRLVGLLQGRWAVGVVAVTASSGAVVVDRTRLAIAQAKSRDAHIQHLLVADGTTHDMQTLWGFGELQRGELDLVVSKQLGSRACGTADVCQLTNDQHSWRSLVVAGDSALLQQTDNSVMWVREEGLSTVHQVASFKIPSQLLREGDSLLDQMTLLGPAEEAWWISCVAAVAASVAGSVRRAWSWTLSQLQPATTSKRGVSRGVWEYGNVFRPTPDMTDDASWSVSTTSQAQPPYSDVRTAPTGGTLLRALGFGGAVDEGGEEEGKLFVPDMALIEEISNMRRTGLHRFGWTNLLILATHTNKVYAVHAATGTIVWQRRLYVQRPAAAAAVGRNRTRGNRNRDFLNACTTGGGQHNYPPSVKSGTNGGPPPLSSTTPSACEGRIASLELVGARHMLVTYHDYCVDRTLLIWLNALCGSVVHSINFPFLAQHVVPLGPATTTAATAATTAATVDTAATTATGATAAVDELDVLVVPVGELQGIVVSPTHRASGRDDLGDVEAGILFQFDQARLTGYGLSAVVPGGGRVVEQIGTTLLQPRWNVDLSGSSQVVAGSAMPLHSAWGNVPVLVQGDATIMYKYINPNMLVLLATPTSASAPAHISAEAVPRGSVYAVNLIDGSIVFSETLPEGAALPANLLVCENVIIVHYWNIFSVRYEIHVIELYDADKDKGPWSLLFSTTRHHRSVLSSFDLHRPVAYSRTYVCAAAFRAASVTSTKQGVTPRAVIAAVASQQILSVPLRMLSSRRPLTHDAQGRPATPLTAAEKEEGLPPYRAVLPLPSTDVISYYLQVMFVRGIRTDPTELESTSTVFAFGLDLFFSPVQPAHGYDVLSSQFNYGLLTAAVSVIVVGLFVTGRMARKNSLNFRWK